MYGLFTRLLCQASRISSGLLAFELSGKLKVFVWISVDSLELLRPLLACGRSWLLWSVHLCFRGEKSTWTGNHNVAWRAQYLYYLKNNRASSLQEMAQMMFRFAKCRSDTAVISLVEGWYPRDPTVPLEERCLPQECQRLRSWYYWWPDEIRLWGRRNSK